MTSRPPSSEPAEDPYKRAWESKSRFSQFIWKYTGVVVTQRPEPGSILSPRGVLVTVIFLAALAGIVVAIIIAGANAQPRASDPPPAAVVQRLAEAWDSRDCEAMKEVTARALREFQGWSDCAEFVTATVLPEGGDFYPTGNMEVTVEGRTAVVWACDAVPAPEDWSCMHYELDYTGWEWLVAYIRR
jgi:hypothetical protein